MAGMSGRLLAPDRPDPCRYHLVFAGVAAISHRKISTSAYPERNFNHPSPLFLFIFIGYVKNIHIFACKTARNPHLFNVKHIHIHLNGLSPL